MPQGPTPPDCSRAVWGLSVYEVHCLHMEQKNTPLVGVVIAIAIIILGALGFMFSHTQQAELDSALTPTDATE